MSTNPEPQTQAEPVQPVKQSGNSGKKSVLALAIFALGLNGAAAVYTMSPADFVLPDVGSLAELLPHQRPASPMPDPVVTALTDIQLNQQQHVALLEEHSDLLRQDLGAIAALRQSVTDEQGDVKRIFDRITDEDADVKKVSSQLSTLIAKVDTLQTALTAEMTSSIPKARTHLKLTQAPHKKVARTPQAVGPGSVGAPGTTAPMMIWGQPKSPTG